MRFHVAALPHTQTTRDYNICAYTNKVRGFCRMMVERGHEVILYSGDQNDAVCTEHVALFTEAERAVIVGDRPYVEAPFDPKLPHWKRFNGRAAQAISKRKRPRDFLCLIAGTAQQPLADSLPDMMAVEWGVGYAGTFAKYRAYESYAWMHTSYGADGGKNADGRWYDAVIPGYLDPAQFPFRVDDDGYYLFVGRLIERKGLAVAQQACQQLGARLIVAGPGGFSGYGEYVGTVGIEERGRLMAGAKAVLVPSYYLEPFGNVAIEAMACGTPVITSDWGAFTETVIDGVTGFRCRTLQEFVDAAGMVDGLDPHIIRKHVVEHYSLDVVGAQFDRWFERLLGLYGAGWGELRSDLRHAA